MLIAETHRTPTIPAPLIGGAAMLVAIVVGRFVANGRLALGVGVVVAVAYLLLVLFDLAAAIAGWAALLFIVHLAVLRSGPLGVQLLVVIAWVGAAGVHRGRAPVLAAYRRLPLAMVVLAVWLTLSIAWAERAGPAAIAAGYWWQAVLAFVVVATTLTTARDVRFVAVAFAIGSVVSVALGLAGIGGATNPVTASQFGDRLVGGGGDPNYQAAGFVGAMFVTAGLTSVVRQRTSRIALIAALVFTMIGFFATQSRGGLLALGFALITAFALFPRLRSRILGWAAITAVGLAAWLPSRPDILHRLTDFGGGASGRQDQWTIAWRIFLDHPLLGIGLDNFRLLEGRFTLLPGSLNHVHLVAETPEVVHNTYLQLLTETGVLGLIGFLAVSLGSLRAAWLAARRFDTLGRTDYANLARSILVGTIGMLAAIFFISDGTDLRLWILFALGPVLLSLANHSSAAASHGSVVYRPAPHLRGGTPGRQGVFR